MKNFEGVTGEQKKKEKTGKKKGRSRNKKEGNYPYFISLFNIGPCDRKKKQELISNEFKGGERFFRVAIIYTPVIDHIFGILHCEFCRRYLYIFWPLPLMSKKGKDTVKKWAFLKFFLLYAYMYINRFRMI